MKKLKPFLIPLMLCSCGTTVKNVSSVRTDYPASATHKVIIINNIEDDKENHGIGLYKGISERLKRCNIETALFDYNVLRLDKKSDLKKLMLKFGPDKILFLKNEDLGSGPIDLIAEI